MSHLFERLLCWTIGCRSLFARWFEWPYHLCHIYAWRGELRQISRDMKALEEINREIDRLQAIADLHAIADKADQLEL